MRNAHDRGEGRGIRQTLNKRPKSVTLEGFSAFAEGNHVFVSFTFRDVF